MRWRHSCSQHVRRVPDPDGAGHALRLDRSRRLLGHRSIVSPARASMTVSPNQAARSRGVGERGPDRGDGVRQVAAEGDRGAVAVDLEGSVAVVSHPCPFCEVLLEGVEVVAPVPAVPADPVVDLDQPVGPQRVDPALPVRPDLDEADLPQDPQMPGHGGLGERRQARYELACGPLALGQQIEQHPPMGLGHGLEHVHPTSITSSIYTLNGYVSSTLPGRGLATHRDLAYTAWSTGYAPIGATSRSQPNPRVTALSGCR